MATPANARAAGQDDFPRRYRVTPMRMFVRMARDRRRVVEATLIAAAFSGLPSTLHASIKQRSLRSAAVYVYDTTRAVGTLLPSGRPAFGRGVVVHLAISILCGETLARTLPHNQSARWGAAAGFLIGVINVGVIGRSFRRSAVYRWCPSLRTT